MPGAAAGTSTGDLALSGAVLTLDAAPRAARGGVVVRGGRVVSFDPEPGAARLPPGAVLLGGFTDYHVHLLAMAATRCSTDVSDARSVPDVLDLLASAEPTEGTGWLRGWGIDEHDLVEGRLPTVAELDAAVGLRPLVLHHRTGHLRLVNSAAQCRGGVAPPLPAHQLVAAGASVGAELAAVGVVAVTDATHTNDVAALALLDSLSLPQRVTAMVAVRGATVVDGVEPGARIGDVQVGPAKVMPPAVGLSAVPALVGAAHRAGFTAAVHAVDVDELAVALACCQPGDRIEHVGLCLPEQVQELAAAGVTVVTQPAFVTRRAPKYRAELSEVERGWLYRLGSLHAAGVRVLGSSDAPVVPSRPLEAVDSATFRGFPADRTERIDVESALRLFAENLVVGAPGDLVLLGDDPTEKHRPGQIAAIPVLAVWREGQLIAGQAPQ